MHTYKGIQADTAKDEPKPNPGNAAEVRRCCPCIEGLVRDIGVSVFLITIITTVGVIVDADSGNGNIVLRLARRDGQYDGRRQERDIIVDRVDQGLLVDGLRPQSRTRPEEWCFFIGNTTTTHGRAH